MSRGPGGTTDTSPAIYRGDRRPRVCNKSRRDDGTLLRNEPIIQLEVVFAKESEEVLAPDG